MAHIEHSIEDFQSLVQPLIGLPVSLPWKGYGSTIFLELGKLAPLESPRQHHNKGEACIWVDWDWRVEAAATVLYGSSSRTPKIESGIRTLHGATIQRLAVTDQIPELIVEFSNGHRLRSMVMISDDPQWTLRLHDGSWVSPKADRLLVGDGGPVETTQREEAAIALADQAAARWGIPLAEPKKGACANCSAFVPLDGEGGLWVYGVCLANSSPFDGRVVNRSSGCPSFSSNKSASRSGETKHETN